MNNFLRLSEYLNSTQKFLTFNISDDEMEAFSLFLKEHHSFNFLLDYLILNEDKKLIRKIFLLSLEKSKIIMIKSELDPSRKIYSFSKLWPNSYYFEFYYKKSFNLDFTITSIEFKPDDKTTFFESSFNLNGTFPRSFLKIENEKVDIFVPELKKMSAFLTSIDNNDDINSSLQKLYKFHTKLGLENQINFLMLFEEGNQKGISDKAKALRMVFLEVNRIISHLEYFMGTHFVFKETGEISILLRFRDSLKEIFKFYLRGDDLSKLVALGGCTFDAPSGWISLVNSTVTFFKKEIIKLYKEKFTDSRWVSHFSTHSSQKISPLDSSLSGPNLRSFGISYDLRKRMPYYFYDELDFKVPVGIFGKHYDRFLVRYYEIFESLKIISELTQNFPSGEHLTPLDFHDLIFEENKMVELEAPFGFSSFCLEKTDSSFVVSKLFTHRMTLLSAEKLTRGAYFFDLDKILQGYGLETWEF